MLLQIIAEQQARVAELEGAAGAELVPPARLGFVGRDPTRETAEVDAIVPVKPRRCRRCGARLCVAATLKQQRRNIVDYITAACDASLHGKSAPSLLPTTSGTA